MEKIFLPRKREESEPQLLPGVSPKSQVRRKESQKPKRVFFHTSPILFFWL